MEVESLFWSKCTRRKSIEIDHISDIINLTYVPNIPPLPLSRRICKDHVFCDGSAPHNEVPLKNEEQIKQSNDS
jgi:hypothetical protein